MDTPERARTYSKTKAKIALAGTGISLAGSAVFLASGLAKKLARRFIHRRKPPAGERLKYEAALATGSWLLGLPLGFYSGYVIEQRYNLSNQSVANWFVDQIKGQALGLALGLPVIEGLYWVIQRYPKHWWLVASGASIPLTAVLAQMFPIVVAPLFNEYAPLDDEQLAERLRTLSEGTGIEIVGIMKMDMSRRTNKANAFFTGLGSTKRIILSDTLLARFDDDEIETIVAHEIAHQANHDIWRFIGLSALFSVATTALIDRLGKRLIDRLGTRSIGTNQLSDIRSLPVLGFSFGLASLVLGPFHMAYSREIERRADAFALALTRKPAAYGEALRKLATFNLTDPSPPRLLVWLLHSHPPTSERIARANAAFQMQSLAHEESSQ